jgi:tetratricopeptide (TPR) repeat protein
MADGSEARYLEGVARWRERDLPAAVERLSSVVTGQPHDDRDGWWHAASRALAQIDLEADGEDAQSHLLGLQGTGVGDAQTLALRSRVWFQAGNEEAALTEIHGAAVRLATDPSSDVGSLMNGAIALIWCAEVLVELGFADDASALTTRARMRMTEADVQDRVLQAMLCSIDASAARLVGDIGAAGGILDSVETSLSPDLHIEVTREWARIAHTAGRSDEAAELYDECLEYADRYGYAFLARSIATELTNGPPRLRTDRAPIGQWDPRAMENVPDEHRPYALVLRLPLPGESEVLDLEDRITELLCDHPGLGHVDGTGTDGRAWEVFLDGDDPDALWDAVRPLLESTPAWHAAEITKRTGSSSLRFRFDRPGL